MCKMMIRLCQEIFCGKWQSLVTVLYTCDLIMLKVIRTGFGTEPISEHLCIMLKPSVRLPDHNSQCK